jgi:succinate dehydrogenase / fumarate reductase iron-sulfur subunit
MSETKWNITLLIYRQKGSQPPHYDTFKLEVDPDEYVLDAVERVWAFHDRSLTFAHACHHSTCGACGMRVNGVEKLTCIVPIRDVAADGGTLRIEPLRNFPIISDLAVNMGSLYAHMEQVGHRAVLPLSEEPAEPGVKPVAKAAEDDYIRLSDCIECGLCISACPISTTTATYLGPAVLAGAQQHGLDGGPDLLALVDCADGMWRCHQAFECTAVCPSNVEPGLKIMQLRQAATRQWIKRLFGSKK